MGAEKINGRSYRRQHQKKLALAAAIICWFILAFNFAAVFKPYFRPPPINSDGDTNMNHPTIFNYSNSKSDVYELNGDVRIHGRSSTIFIASSRRHHLSWINSHTIKPHPRKTDAAAMATVSAFQFKVAPPHKLPHCTQNLPAPAILFSTGAHAGNHFHSINDVLLPLFATAHRLHRHVIFLVTNHDPRLISKHRQTLGKLSRYEIINIDRQNETLCFQKLIAGLKAHKSDLSIDPSPSSTFSSRNFTKLLRNAYSLERESVHVHGQYRPRMLVISRRRTRRLTNEPEVVDLARRLGFEAVALGFESNMTSVAKLVNGVDVMVGVHGAGLTNMIFLPENAVVIQITPLGLDNFARMCYGPGPEEEMKLKYLEYKVRLNESSLLGKYPADSEVYKNPNKFCSKKGFKVCKDVFMDNQDVNLDLGRFRKTLLKALELLAA